MLPLPDVLRHAGVVPDVQGVKAVRQGLPQGRSICSALPGLSGEQNAVQVLGRVRRQSRLQGGPGVLPRHVHL